MSELTNIENGKVKLSLKIPAEDYRRALESAYRRTGAHYNIPGFRKGKVPRKVIEATYGVNVFWDEEFDSLVQSVYSDALAEHNLVPEIQPNIEFTEVSEQDGVSFTAEVVLHPTVKLGQYPLLNIMLRTKKFPQRFRKNSTRWQPKQPLRIVPFVRAIS